MSTIQPVRMFGGKGNMLSKLYDQFPPPDSYEIYAEPFGGSGVVLLNKPRTAVEIYNDLDNNLYALFAVLSDPPSFDEFKRRCVWASAFYHERLRAEFKESLQYEDLSLIDRAYYFWYVNRTSMNGIGGYSVNTVLRNGISKSASDMLSSVNCLPAIFERLTGVIVYNRDAIELIRHRDRPKTFMYLDPPYVHSTRTEYRYPVDADDDYHRALVQTLLEIKHAKILLSGYDNQLYTPLETAEGWVKTNMVIHTTAGGFRTPKDKIETLWRNYTTAQPRLEGF